MRHTASVQPAPKFWSDSLAAEGVDTIFGLPGLQLDYIFDALYGRHDTIRVIHTRHEQATAYMAFGYAQASGPRRHVPCRARAPAYSTRPRRCRPPMLATRRCFASPGRFLQRTSAAASASCTRFRTRTACSLRCPNGRPASPRRPMHARSCRKHFVSLNSGRRRPVVIEIPPDIAAAR